MVRKHLHLTQGCAFRLGRGIDFCVFTPCDQHQRNLIYYLLTGWMWTSARLTVPLKSLNAATASLHTAKKTHWQHSCSYPDRQAVLNAVNVGSWPFKLLLLTSQVRACTQRSSTDKSCKIRWPTYLPPPVTLLLKATCMRPASSVLKKLPLLGVGGTFLHCIA